MENKYLAIRDSTVIGTYDTLDDAKTAIKEAISRDKMIIFFKKRLLKRFFKGSYNPNDHVYYCAEVCYNETNFSLSI